MKFDTLFLEDADIQLIDGDRGSNYPKQSDFMEAGYCLFLSAKNVTNNGFVFNEKVYIDKESDALLRAGKLSRGDIVVTTRGTIGNVAFYDDSVPFENVRINSGMMIFRASKETWNQRLLYFLLCSEFVQQQIVSLTSGSAVPQLPARDLKKFRLPRIPREIQDRISVIVGSVADKIQLNRQINQTLEEMAQAIFKSWFVDFEPVKAKIEAKVGGQDPERAAMCAISGKTDAELDNLSPDQLAQLRATTALFPDELTDSELGLIPKGWETKRIDSILELAYGKALKKVNRKPGQVPVYGSGGVNGFHDKHFVEGPGIIVGRKGTVGSLHWEDDNFFPIDTVFYVMPQKDFSLEYIFYLLKTLGLQNMNTDAAVPGLNRNNVYRLVVAGHPEELVEVFSNMVGPFSNKMSQIKKENDSLVLIRDTLLPKLLSGEISIDSAQAVIEAES